MKTSPKLIAAVFVALGAPVAFAFGGSINGGGGGGSSTMSAAAILASLLTVDGAASTLDADLCDGADCSLLAPKASPTFTGTVTAPTITLTGQVKDAVSVIAYAATIDVDFAATTGGMKDVALTGNVTITASNIAAGTHASLRVVADSSSRNFTALPSWTFVGSAAPTAIAANKTGVFAVDCYSTTAASCVAAYSVQP